jgi:excisionase family DNA binding protein
MDKKYYSIPEAAKICGVDRITVRRWVLSSKIKAEKIGRNYAIAEEQLEPWLAAKNEYSAAVHRVIEDYGETLRLLAKE